MFIDTEAANMKRMWTASKIRALRVSFGDTQKQFAQRLGVVTDTVRYWEQGRGLPKGPAEKLLTILKGQLDRQPAGLAA